MSYIVFTSSLISILPFLAYKRLIFFEEISNFEVNKRAGMSFQKNVNTD